MSAKTLQFPRRNQLTEFSDLLAATNVLASHAVGEAQHIALSRHPKTYEVATHEVKVTSLADFGADLLEAAAVKLRMAAAIHLAETHE